MHCDIGHGPKRIVVTAFESWSHSTLSSYAMTIKRGGRVGGVDVASMRSVVKVIVNDYFTPHELATIGPIGCAHIEENFLV